MRLLVFILALAFMLSACSLAVAPLRGIDILDDPATEATPLPPEVLIGEGEPRITIRVDDPKIYHLTQMFPLDGIRPIYDPVFESGSDVDLQEDELILGEAIDGQRLALFHVQRLDFRLQDREAFYKGLGRNGPKAVKEFRTLSWISMILW